jgi:putative flippase GtrA
MKAPAERARTLIGHARSPMGKKAIRYTLTSVVAVAVAQAFLFFFYAGLDWSARTANVAATTIGAIPSFLLNRYWAWGLRGRAHFRKEIVPFWALAILGVAFSTWAAGWAESKFDGNALAVNAASLGAFGILWVVKFVIFNELLFKHHPEKLEEAPALDGRTGLPT